MSSSKGHKKPKVLKVKDTLPMGALPILSVSLLMQACGDTRPDSLEELKNQAFTSAAELSRFVPLTQLFDFIHPENLKNSLVEVSHFGSKMAEMPHFLQNSSMSLAGSEFEWKVTGAQDWLPGDKLYSSHLTFRGLEVMNAELKYLGSYSMVSGNVPRPLVEGNDFKSVGNFNLAEDEVKNKAAAHLKFSPQRFQNAEKMYLASGADLLAIYRFTVSAASLAEGDGPSIPLHVIVNAEDGSVISQIPLATHLNGTAKVYKENSTASTEGMATVTLSNLLDTSKLESTQFKVVNCSASSVSTACAQTASGSAGNYSNIAFSSEAYDEVIAYYSLATAIAWNQKIMGMDTSIATGLGAKAPWTTQRSTLGLSSQNQLTVFVRAQTVTPSRSTTLDNAQYLPFGLDGLSSPYILVGTGWEDGQGSQRSLRYLGKDADVSMHEFGHHIVYRSIREVTGQSASMHEGFADFFTYAITGNNKLGESIVTAGGPLRQGTVTGVISDQLSKAIHKQGEFWSSVLWDIRVDLGVWKDSIYKADKIIWDSIDLMKTDAKYYDAIGAITTAAEKFAAISGDNAVTLKTKIHNVFYKRGFIDMPDGSGNLPTASTALSSVDSSGSAASASQQVDKDKTESKGFWSCGSVADNSMSTSLGQWVLILAGILVPALLPVPVRVRQRKKK